MHHAANAILVSEASRVYNAELEASVGIFAGMKSKCNYRCGCGLAGLVFVSVTVIKIRRFFL